ncbi:hypothetical protein M388_02190 [Mesotoga sp. Brook.08.YT.4.2.5.4.]|nr:hypothetical protein M388_02190 [Mesotoga sp. Brook.08.YT.4.2.5.4.]
MIASLSTTFTLSLGFPEAVITRFSAIPSRDLAIRKTPSPIAPRGFFS